MTKEEIDKIEAVLKKHPDWGRRRLTVATGISCNRMQAYLTARKRGTTLPPVHGTTRPVASGQVPSGPSVKKVSVKDFLAKLDYPAILAKAIKVHCKSDFIAESDMRLVSQLNPNAFRQAVNSGEFSDNQLKSDGVTWWSTVENVKAAKMKRGIV